MVFKLHGVQHGRQARWSSVDMETLLDGFSFEKVDLSSSHSRGDGSPLVLAGRREVGSSSIVPGGQTGGQFDKLLNFFYKGTVLTGT